MHAITIGIPTVVNKHENLENFVVFGGNTVSNITGNTLGDQGMLFGTFLMKNIFINFPTLILNHVCCSISLKFPCFSIANLMACAATV